MAPFSRITPPLLARLSGSSLGRGQRWQAPRTLSVVLVKGTRKLSLSVAMQVKKYTQDHEWIELSDNGSTGTIGITTYAAKSLGDVVYVELPVMDLEVNAGDSIGAVESVKSASDIMTPVAGKIVEANSILEEKPGIINKGPEGEGWIAKIAVKDKAEIEKLMGSTEYKKFTEE
ncbi:MAG: glycine cleavage system H-protein subunit [Pycnora praestabilis]|nr:MAG: glycine cleavage system H-protein subunit [Pycnora praestabilis]